jgi:hypothetical protein
MVFSENRFPLCVNAAVPVRIMLYQSRRKLAASVCAVYQANRHA